MKLQRLVCEAAGYTASAEAERDAWWCSGWLSLLTQSRVQLTNVSSILTTLSSTQLAQVLSQIYLDICFHGDSKSYHMNILNTEKKEKIVSAYEHTKG